MYYPIIDFTLVVFYICLMLMVFNINQGVNLLILSELCWVCLFVCYTLQGLFMASLLSYTYALVILILAAVDCSLWILLLVYQMLQTNGPRLSAFGGLHFMFRLNKLMRANKFIK